MNAECRITKGTYSKNDVEEINNYNAIQLIACWTDKE